MNASGTEHYGKKRVLGWWILAGVVIVGVGVVVAVYVQPTPPPSRQPLPKADEVADLKKRLRDPNPAERLAAAAMLGEGGPEAAPFAPALCEWFTDRSEANLKDAAGAALVKIGPGAVPALLDVFDQCKDKHDQERVLRVLSEIARPDYQHFLKATRDKDKKARERETLRAALLLVTPTPAAAVPELLQALRDPADEGRAFAVTALGRAEPSALPEILQALRDKDVNVRRGAVLALRGLPPRPADLPEATIPTLLDALKDADAPVRAGAAYALGAVRPPSEEIAAALFGRCTDDDPEVRGTAAYALGRLGDLALPRLVAALDDARPVLRLAAVRGLTGWWSQAKDTKSPPSAEFVAAVVRGLEDQDSEVRLEVLNALTAVWLPENETILRAEVGALVKTFAGATAESRKMLLEDLSRLAWRETAGKKPPARATVGAFLVIHRDAKLREEVGQALTRFGPFAVAAVVELLADKDDAVRDDASQALVTLTKRWHHQLIYDDRDNERVLTRILLGLQHADAGVRRHLVRFFTASRSQINDGEACAEIAASLKQSLTDADQAVRRAAVGALVRYGQQADITEVVRLLKDQDNETRLAAVEALGSLRGPPPRQLDGANLPLFTQALRHKDAAIRRIAAEALGWVEGTDANTLADVIEALDDSDKVVRDMATKTLGGSGGPAVLPLIKALKLEKPEVRAGAVAALIKIGPAAVPTLTDALQDKEKATRVGAAQALGGIGPAASKSVPALRQALLDEEEEVRQAAAAALKAVAPGDRK